MYLQPDVLLILCGREGYKFKEEVKKERIDYYVTHGGIITPYMTTEQLNKWNLYWEQFWKQFCSLSEP